MKTNPLRSFFALMGFSLLLSSCIKDEIEETVKHYTDDEYAILSKTLNLPQDKTDYSLKIPEHLGNFTISADHAKATLGRVLFYDKRLSDNNAVSCASCHKPEHAFADDVAFSEGFLGDRTDRNSLSLGAFPSFNAYYGFGGGSRLFWDERAGSVREQSEQTLENPVEMGMNLNELGEKLLQEDYYQILFDKAFPDNQFGSSHFSTSEKILQALESFVNAIGCFDSRYDRELAKTKNPAINFPAFSARENLGKQLFDTHCANCHNLGAGFATFVTVANNGLDMEYEDNGVAEVSHDPTDEGVFKVPMLRNVALTAPYMHDGRFATLEEVIEHYSTGVKDHPNLHPELKNGNEARRLNLTPNEKDALVAFLLTLTDLGSVTQEKYSNPFK